MISVPTHAWNWATILGVARVDPTPSTAKALFAASGNQCAMCKSTLLRRMQSGSVLIAEMAHICAAEPGGPRFDPAMSSEDRRDFDNLLVLCFEVGSLNGLTRTRHLTNS